MRKRDISLISPLMWAQALGRIWLPPSAWALALFQKGGSVMDRVLIKLMVWMAAWPVLWYKIEINQLEWQ